jgi:hypothetical protein
MSEEIKTPARPKYGTYPTFTTKKKASTKCLQKAQYGLDEFKTRKLMSEKVSVTVQAGVEFDVYRECFGGPDGAGRSPYFHKMITEGYLKNGTIVKLEAETLQKFLESQVRSDTNQVYLWKDRPRTARERELENAVEAGEKKAEALTADKAKLEAILKKHNIKIEG